MDAEGRDLLKVWTDDLPWLGQYVLDERGNPVPAAGLLQWGEWMQTANRQVALTEFPWGCVSTVFLGLDCNFDPVPMREPLHYQPVLWETMIFVKPAYTENAVLKDLDMEQRRYRSREGALEGHREMVERVKRQVGNREQ